MCQHQCADKATQTTPSCSGSFLYCTVRLDDRQFSDFLRHEVMSNRAELVTHVGDHELGIMIEKDTWLATELIRRFGQRQSRGVESVFKIKQGMFKLAVGTMPMDFGEFIIFPLDSA